MNIYKTYDPDGNALIFHSLRELRIAFDLSHDEVKRCHKKGVHIVACGVEITTY